MSKESKKGAVERSDDINIGTKLNHIRIRKELTLKQLSKIIGCSESLLSKVENYRANPSLNMVRRIATALGVTVGELYSRDADPLRIVSRAGTRPLIEMSQLRRGHGLLLERLIPYSDEHLLQGSIHHIAPGVETDGPLQHEGEKFGYVLNGELELRVADQIFIVKQDDSFCFRSNQPHSYRNPGEQPARLLWLNTPPNF